MLNQRHCPSFNQSRNIRLAYVSFRSIRIELKLRANILMVVVFNNNNNDTSYFHIDNEIRS